MDTVHASISESVMRPTPVQMLSSASVQRTQNGFGILAMKLSVAAQWAALDDHFRQHAKQVERFRQAGPDAVRRMWKHQTNELGQCLSQCEREALIERHCELFGTWPN